MNKLPWQAWPFLLAGALVSAVVLSQPRQGAGATPPAAPTTLRALYGMQAPEALSRGRTALVLVDFQEEFFSGRLPLPDGANALAQAARLAAWARRHGVSVVHVKNEAKSSTSPVFAPGSAGVRFVAPLRPAPGELVVTKPQLGGFSGTALHDELRARGVETLLLAGLMTHLAVQVTAADAARLGYRVVVAGDAVATRALPGVANLAGVDAETLQRASLAALADRVADVMPSRAITELPLVD